MLLQLIHSPVTKAPVSPLSLLADATTVLF